VYAAPAITSIVLANQGATTGTLEKDDTIEITFSQALSVSSLCSTWSGDTTNQSLVASNDVTVNVSNGTSPTNDVLTVVSGSCTFNFGSLDLGSANYVTAAAAFGGNGISKSTVTWTASTRKLLIRLGGLKSGTVATVASSAPTYSASASVVDPYGAGISNTPYAPAAAKQF